MYGRNQNCHILQSQFYYDFSQIISADDRAIQFGDGAYEWIRIHHGHSFGLSYHTDRLYRSMRLLGIRPVTAPDEFTEIVEVVVEESEIEEGYVKIIVTRGVMTITSLSLQEVRFNRMSLYMGSLLI